MGVGGCWVEEPLLNCLLYFLPVDSRDNGKALLKCSRKVQQKKFQRLKIEKLKLFVCDGAQNTRSLTNRNY